MTRIRRYTRILLSVVAAAILGVAVSNREAVAKIDHLDFILSSSALSSTYFPWYIATEQGYLADEGLDVEFITGPGSGNAVQQLLAENADIAVVTPAAVIGAVAQGYGMKLLAEHWYAAQFNILVPEKSSIKTFSDLKGEALGIPELSGSEVTVALSAVALQGWTPGVDLRLTVVGEGVTMLRALQQGQVVAVASNLPNQLRLESELGFKLRSITPDEVKFHGDSLAVRDDTYADPDYHDALVGFVRAGIKGWLWAKAHPDEAYKVVKSKYAKEQLGDPGDDSYGRPYFDKILELTSPPAGDVRYGEFVEGATQQVADFLFKLKEIDKEVDMSKVIVDDIVKEAWTGVDIDAVKADPAKP